MNDNRQEILSVLAISFPLLVGLPLLGAWLAGMPLGIFLRLPARLQPVVHAPFSWPAFAVAALTCAGLLGGILALLVGRSAVRHTSRRRTPMPWWGWVGIAVVLTSWILAWNRFPWFAPFQPYTFTPLWLGYILTLNAWTTVRIGRCVMVERPSFLLALFPVSAVIWWYFEYLNGFVRNWFYLGTDGLTDGAYALHATIAFSTVLPAVISTTELLGSFDHLVTGPRQGPVVNLPHPRWARMAGLIVGGTVLALVGIFPNYAFSAVWVAPFLILVGTEASLGQDTVLTSLADGDWRPVVLPALAALLCGLVWEMWNAQSLAHWVYAIPFVDRFQIFEMPVLGYAGYLPFGLECAVVADLVRRWFDRKH
jgi:hypothetical protein